QRVTKLRSVVSNISNWRKSRVICARCESVSAGDNQWTQVGEYTLLTLDKENATIVICPACESDLVLKPKVENLEKRRKARGK
ncbi:MAG TPA: hypothetical protein VEQ34_04080, partial [Pyrinomonadaceae bacterium]|nr:hypothetical protein [Pyrinomonadaceae bacterium]